MGITVKYFKREEFNCTHTNKNEMDDAFLEKLDQLREACGFPFVITSGYRDSTHPNEVNKDCLLYTSPSPRD